MKKTMIQKLLVTFVPLLLLAFAIVPASAQDYVLYTVQQGDTLSKIGLEYCTTWSEIYEINKQAIGADVNVLLVGTLLTVPDRCVEHSGSASVGTGGSSTGNTAPASGVYDRGSRQYATGTVVGNTYTVAWGDTIFSIAERFGLTKDDILYSNEGSSNFGLRAGTQILIPGLSGITNPNPGVGIGSSNPGGAISTLPASAPGVYDRGPIEYARGTTNANRRYTVAAGDTLFSIGLRFGVTREQLLDSNESVLNFGLRAGATIIIPGLTTDVQNPFSPDSGVQPVPETPPTEPITEISAERIAELDDVVFHANIPEIQREMDSGRLTSVELTLYFLDRINKYESLNTMITINPNAVSEAFNADVLRSQGTILGPLHGIPVNLKDNIATTGPMSTTGGSVLLQDYVATEDTPLAAQLKAGGAVILGKANLSEFAGAIDFSAQGESALGGNTINPYGSQYTSGGSSSGSGASTAAFLTMGSVGSETSGSLIAPASFNGVVGMYPSNGIVDGTGVIPLFEGTDSAGPIARSVTDIALLLGVIDTVDVNYVDALNANALNGVTVGLLREKAIAAVSAEAIEGIYVTDNIAILDRLANVLTTQGVTITEATYTEEAELATSRSGLLVLGGIRYHLLPYLESLGAPVSTPEDLIAYNLEDSTTRIPFGQAILELAAMSSGPEIFADADDFENASNEIKAVTVGALDAMFAASGADVLVSIDNVDSALYTTANYPAISVPFGIRENGMPVGAVFIGKQGEEAQLLAYAYAFEQATQARINPQLD